jgi:hypothetical protein
MIDDRRGRGEHRPRAADTRLGETVGKPIKARAGLAAGDRSHIAELSASGEIDARSAVLGPSRPGGVDNPGVAHRGVRGRDDAEALDDRVLGQ